MSFKVGDKVRYIKRAFGDDEYRYSLGSIFTITRTENDIWYYLDNDNTPMSKDQVELINEPVENTCKTPVKHSEKASDTQIAGSHYSSMKIQPMEYALANNLNLAQGNVVKYVSRYKAKNGKEDLEKAIHCIQLLIEHEYPE